MIEIRMQPDRSNPILIKANLRNPNSIVPNPAKRIPQGLNPETPQMVALVMAAPRPLVLENLMLQQLMTERPVQLVTRQAALRPRPFPSTRL